MKNAIFILLSAVIMSNAAYAQKISADKIPVVVTEAFNTKFPTAKKATWEMENKLEYEVNFKLNNEELSATYDNSGSWLETETEIKVSALPTAVQSSLKKDFVDCKINEASKIESANNKVSYEAEIEKGEETFDVLFSIDGKVLNKTKLEEKD